MQRPLLLNIRIWLLAQIRIGATYPNKIKRLNRRAKLFLINSKLPPLQKGVEYRQSLTTISLIGAIRTLVDTITLLFVSVARAIGTLQLVAYRRMTDLRNESIFCCKIADRVALIYLMGHLLRYINSKLIYKRAR